MKYMRWTWMIAITGAMIFFVSRIALGQDSDEEAEPVQNSSQPLEDEGAVSGDFKNAAVQPDDAPLVQDAHTTEVPPTKKTEEAVPREIKPSGSSDGTAHRSRKAKNHSISVGFGAPICGFAVGAINGSGCLKTSEPFFWGNLPIKYHRRVNKRFAWAVGLMPSFIYLAEVAGLVGHIVGDFRVYAVPDWLYFKLDIFMGFPLIFALGPAVGHSFKISKKVSLYLENQFIVMAVAGVYGMWQPILGVDIKL